MLKCIKACLSYDPEKTLNINKAIEFKDSVRMVSEKMLAKNPPSTAFLPRNHSNCAPSEPFNCAPNISRIIKRKYLGVPLMLGHPVYV